MRRHDRVILKKSAHVRSVRCCTSDRAYGYVQRWIASGHAFVCPRQRDTLLHLGMVFVEHNVRHRVTIQTDSGDVLQVKPPLLLSECLQSFSAAEAEILRKLNQQIAALGSHVHVFGSVGWELTSGDVYRTETSDLDLLIDVSSIDQARKIVGLIWQAASQLSFRIDGELRFPTNACVNWYEFALALENGGNADLLVKRESDVCLIALSELLEASHV